MMKKWYQVTFYANMSEDDVRDMKNHFFNVMSDSLEISECDDLTIEEDTPANEAADEAPDFILEDGSYEIDDETGELKINIHTIDQSAIDDYIRVQFIDEDDEPISAYKVVDTDSDWVYCEFLE